MDGLKNFNAHKQFLCQQNLLDLMKMLYGEHWDPNREPCFSPDLKGDSPADPNFLKLPLFGLFVKAVFTLPISSAIVEMLFSRSELFQAPQLLHWPHSRVGLSAIQAIDPIARHLTIVARSTSSTS